MKIRIYDYLICGSIVLAPFTYMVAFKYTNTANLIDLYRFGFTCLIILQLSYSHKIYLNKVKVNPSILFFSLVILNGLISNLLYLQVDNIASLGRYILYLLGLIILREKIVFLLIKYIEQILLIFLTVGVIQTITGDTYLVNMAERVAGPYYLHASGYSLFLVTTLPILIYKISKEGLSFFRFICLLTGLFILLRTGSRAGLIGFLISIILVYGKKIFSKYTVLVLFISLVSFRSQLIDFFFDNPLLKRFVYLFKNGIFDASSNERVDIIIRSINGLDSLQRVFGIGIGYFDNFQESIVGERIAAHNNFLLFFIEGGLFLLIFFIIHLVWIAVKISKVKDINKKKLLVLLFLNIELFGLINNNLYYYIPYFISLIIIHEFISEKKWKSLKY
jgi:hypothetical protein